MQCGEAAGQDRKLRPGWRSANQIRQWHPGRGAGGVRGPGRVKRGCCSRVKTPSGRGAAQLYSDPTAAPRAPRAQSAVRGRAAAGEQTFVDIGAITESIRGAMH